MLEHRDSVGIFWSPQGWGLDALSPAVWGDMGLLESSGDLGEQCPETD